MFKLLATILLSLGIANGYCLEVEKISENSMADANFCGDINSVITFKITSFNTSDLSTMRSFTLTKENLKVLGQHLYNSDKNFIVTATNYNALQNLKGDLLLQLDKNNGETYLGSCWPLEILSKFNLKIDSKNETLTTINENIRYFTIAPLFGVYASEYNYNVVVDLDKLEITAFIIW